MESRDVKLRSGKGQHQSGTKPTKNDELKKKHPPEEIKLNRTQELSKSTTNDIGCRKRFISLLKYVLLALFVPPFLNYAALIREEKLLKPEGELYDVGEGQKMFLYCEGQGTPAVILDSPSGYNSDVWTHIFKKITKTTKVCVYDRAGLGFSDRPIKVRDAGVNDEDQGQRQSRGNIHTTERMVEDLKKIFSDSGKLKRPFILVGAGLGAVNARFYAQMYPNEVAAIILVNPLYEGLFAMDNGPWSKFWHASYTLPWQSLHILSAVGLVRIGFHLGLVKDMLNDTSLPEVIRNRQKYLMCKPGHLSSAVEEHFFVNESLAQIRLLQKVRPLPKNLPVTLISSSKFARSSLETDRIWIKSQEMMLNSLPKTTRVIQSSTEFDNVLLKDYELIAENIRDAIKQWQKDSQKQSKY